MLVLIKHTLTIQKIDPFAEIRLFLAENSNSFAK